MSSTIASKLGNLFRLGRKPVEVSVDGQMMPKLKPRSKREQREAAIQQLQQGYAEVVDTMHAMRSHMEKQSMRSDRLLHLMEGLPEVLHSIPQTNAKQTSVLEAIQGQMQTQVESTGQLSTALTDLAGATRHQQEVLGELHQQMHLGRQQNESLRDSLGILSETMDSVTDASRSNVQAMHEITEQVRGNDSRFRDLFRRSQKHTTVMAAVSWALALGALAISGYVAVMVARVADRIPPQTPPAMTASVTPTTPDTPESVSADPTPVVVPPVEVAPVVESVGDAPVEADAMPPFDPDAATGFGALSAINAIPGLTVATTAAGLALAETDVQ